MSYQNDANPIVQEVTRVATVVAAVVAEATREAVVATEVAAVVEVVADTVASRAEVATGAEDMVSLQAPEARAYHCPVR